MCQLDKARQESKSKEESIKKLEETLQNIENKARSKDHIYKNQQEKIRDLEEELGLKAASHSQSEKQLVQLQERLKGREESCASLQLKVYFNVFHYDSSNTHFLTPNWWF